MRQRIAVLPLGIGQLVSHRAHLEHHHADGVGDDVVQLARDPGALLGDGDARGGLAFVLGVNGALLCRLRVDGAGAQGEAGDPHQHEHQRDEHEISRRVAGVVVDHDRRAADDYREAEPRLILVAQIPQQK